MSQRTKVLRYLETIEHYELLKYEEDSIQATSLELKEFPYEIPISHLLPTLIQSKKGTFWDILSNSRTKIYSRRQLQQQTHSMGLMFKNNKEQIIVKSNPREKLLICINWNTNILVYWQKQNSASTRFLCNQWNLINIHRHTNKLRLNLWPFSNNSNIKHTSNSQKTNTTLARLKNQLGYLQTNNTRQSKSINET